MLRSAPLSAFLAAALVSVGAIAYAQEQPDPRTLIPSPTLNAIAQHISHLEKSSAYTIGQKP